MGASASPARQTGSHGGEITAHLVAARGGDAGALDRLIPLVYEDLRRRAHRELAGVRGGETLCTTALVHETYLRFKRAPQMPWRDRYQFFAATAKAMRHILVDYARRRGAAKRGGGRPTVHLDDWHVAADSCAVEMLVLDAALRRLGRWDRRLVDLVELRFFGGLSVEETARALGISPRTVKRDWRKAKAYLFHTLNEEGAAGEEVAPGAPER